MSNIPFTPDAMLEHTERIAATAFSRFNHLVSTHDTEHLYCFVEGYDSPYYQIRVENISAKNCVFIDSVGKKGVLAIYHLLKNKTEYAKYTKLFFVDRDYDTNESIDNAIYITPSYSIENFYGSIDCFKKIIAGIYHIYEDNVKYQLCVDLYHNLANEFVNATSYFCAWYRCTKTKSNHDVSLAESIPKKYAIFQDGKITKYNYDLATLNEDYPHVDNVTEAEFQESIDYINNSITNIRGKYVMQFIEFIIVLLNKDSLNNKKYTDSRVQFELNKKTMITRLACFADTPICLRKYILEHT